MSSRLLLVTADDFGIGPETTRGILEAAHRGVVTSTVMLVTSPHAAEAVRVWEAAGRPVEVGWHPCLTLDSPLLPPARVPSLVRADGRFHDLGGLLKRIVLGRIDPTEVEAEFRAQLERFTDLVGKPPEVVNAHHHVHVFQAVIEPLLNVLEPLSPRPLLRRVVESVSTLRRVPGARLKRLFLANRGRSAARRQDARSLPGNDALLGVTDPQHVADPNFFVHWLSAARGERVELACHPGRMDVALEGRDADPFMRRPHELERLLAPEFLAAVEAAGFRLATPREMIASATTPRPAGGASLTPQMRIRI